MWGVTWRGKVPQKYPPHSWDNPIWQALKVSLRHNIFISKTSRFWALEIRTSPSLFFFQLQSFQLSINFWSKWLVISYIRDLFYISIFFRINPRPRGFAVFTFILNNLCLFLELEVVAINKLIVVVWGKK
jgi:hypothetical protein